MKNLTYNTHVTRNTSALLLFGFIFLLAFFFPAHTKAMEIYAEQPNSSVKVGSTVLVNIAIDAESEINVIEGTITINNAGDISSITTGGSILSLWPRKPSLEGNKIAFTGGTPSGVYGKSLQLFTIAFTPKTNQPIRISFGNITAYKNDGKGTKVAVKGISNEFKIQADGQTENQYTSLITNDRTPPLPFTIEVGRESSLNDGKYFLSFYTTDADSGVNRYEVEERGFGMVRSGNMYVLQNQELTGVVVVKAIDNANNIRTEKINLGGRPAIEGWNIVLGLVLLLGIATLFYFTRKKKYV